MTIAWIILGSWGCNRSYQVPSLPSLPVTPTPTADPTPSCGFTPVPVVSFGFGGPAGQFVIQDSAGWVSVNGSGSTLPTVDFSSQMILQIGQTVRWSCGCFGNPPAITSVCAYADHIEVDYQNGGPECPQLPAPSLTPVPILVTCNSFFSTEMSSLVIVPKSSLPVTWIAN